MRNSAVVTYEPIDSVVAFYKEMFGNELDLHHALEMASHFLSTRNCLNVRKYSTIVKSSDECLVKIPCNCFRIVSVTDTQDYNWLTAAGNVPTGYSERMSPNVIFLDGQALTEIAEIDQYGNKTGETTPYPEQVQYRPNEVRFDYNKPVVDKPKGNYVNYDVVDDYKIKIPFKEFAIEVIYEGLHLDSKGFMLIDEHQKEALAYYLNFLDMQKRYFAQQIPRDIFEEAKDAKVKAVMRLSNRGYITSNQKDKIAKVMNSHNRFVYDFPAFR